MKIQVTTRLLEKYPYAKFFAVLAHNFTNQKSNPHLEKEKEKIYKEIRKIKDAKLIKRINEHKTFHEKFGRSYPIEFQVNSIREGKDIPTEFVLKDVLFINEMRHYCIISGHDVESLNGDLIFDLSMGTEHYIKINDKPQALKNGDIILKAQEKVITSLLYGPDSSTKITEKTKDCLYLFWFSSPISKAEFDKTITEFKESLRVISDKGSKITDVRIEISSEQKSIVTPWEVKGKVDYDELIREFGTEKINDALLTRLKKHTGELHYMLRRKIFFSHRDLNLVLDEYEKGQEFALYTGRGPSGNTHIGHLVPWIFCKYLQDKFGAELYFQITDDEKFMLKPDASLEKTNEMGYENALDVIACGFDPDKTFIFVDTDYAKTLYKTAIQVAKKVTASSAKAVFGFTNETNIGMMFWPAMQAVPCFLPSVLKGRKIRTLIPAAIDQDPYWRISRDVAPKLGYPKTAAIHNIFLPALTGPGSKMSASHHETAIYTTDKEDVVARKIRKYAFSGGQATIDEHRKKGGNPESDVSYQWLRFFEEDDKKLEGIYSEYKSGALLTGELKQILIDKLTNFLKNHQERREKARKMLDRFILKD